MENVVKINPVTGKAESLGGNNESPTPDSSKKFFSKISLGGILRILGGLVLVGAAGTFLIQKWGAMDHLVRYFSFLGFTAALAGFGIYCGLILKEAKGARAFLSVASGIVPAHFAALGALTYSAVSLEALTHYYPTYFRWVAPDIYTALIATVVGVLVLSNIVFFAFRALVEKDASFVTGIYLGLNAMLLIPTRDPDFVAILLSIFAIGLLFIDTYILRKSTAMKTTEGKLVRVMLIVPVALMVARTLFLYGSSLAFLSALFGVMTLLLFVWLPVSVSETSGKTYQQFSILPLTISWILMALHLREKFHLSHDVVIPFTGLPIAAGIVVMSLYAIGGGASFRKAAARLVIATMTAQLFLVGGIITSFGYIVTSLMTVIYGYLSRQKTMFRIGGIGVVIGLLYHIKYAAELYTFSPWISLGIVGTVLVLASSVVERHSYEFKKMIHTLLDDIKEWE